MDDSDAWLNSLGDGGWGIFIWIGLISLLLSGGGTGETAASWAGPRLFEMGLGGISRHSLPDVAIRHGAFRNQATGDGYQEGFRVFIRQSHHCRSDG